MRFELLTTECKSTGIFGVLSTETSPVIQFSTLEHSYFDHVSFSPKLQHGTYTCVRGHHQLHSGPIETFEVTNVPGHTGILFHYGNYNADSDGCILLGMTREGDMITDSRKAFSEFMDLLKGVDEFTLVVT